MQFIRTNAHYQTACLVVGADNNDGLIGVLLVELVSYLDGLVEVNNLVDAGTYIVAVASPVNLTALNLEEEAVLVL